MDEQFLKSERPGHLRALFGWVVAMLIVVGASDMIVMARTTTLDRERTRLAGEASHGPRALVERRKSNKGSGN
jgi:hypothetical protein